MKFVGKPKDYYDHQAYVWGVDAKIVYDRNPFWPADPPLFEGGQPILKDRDFKVEGEIHFRYQVDGEPHQFGRYLVVCGKLYPLVYCDTKGRIWNTNKVWGPYETVPEQRWEIYRAGYHTWIKEVDKWYSRYPQSSFNTFMKNIVDVEVGDDVPMMETLSKLVHQPIFVINRVTTHGYHRGFESTEFTVDPHYPVTADMGLGQFISPDKLYQEVGYWLSNIINPSPDLMPDGKPPQTDLEKVVAHGFDKKVSFRKRKTETG